MKKRFQQIKYQRERASAFQGMECLPRESVSNVLSRLPAKDLMRCKCVCKFWFDIIIDPHFISNYYVFYNSLEQEERLLLLRTSHHFWFLSETIISIVSWNPNESNGLVSSQPLNHRLHQYEWTSIMGPCNGIYLLLGNTRVIMNPSLRQYITLPQSGTYSCNDYPSFGFDPKTNDYKVVVLKNLTNKVLKGDWRVELFSLNSNSWRNIDANAIPVRFLIGDSFWCCNYVNNCCHWWGYVYRNYDDDVQCVVLSFDMVNELFRQIKVPQITHSLGQCSINFTAFTESATIGLLAYPISQGPEICFCFDVWMMKDYWDDGSWIKQYSIGPLPVIYKQLVVFYKTNQFLWKDSYDRLVFYDPHCDKQTRNLPVSQQFESTSAAAYMESLVSLKRGNQSSSH